jgi:putative tricarboxylic transport membrane protein
MSRRLAETVIRHLPALVVLVLLALFGYVVVAVQGFMLGARLFPLYVASAGIVLAVVELMRQLLRGGTEAAEPGAAGAADLGIETAEQTPAGYARALRLFLWVVAYYGLLTLVGGLLGSALFALAFLRLRFGVGWLAAAAVAAGIGLFAYALVALLALRLPVGALAPWLGGL